MNIFSITTTLRFVPYKANQSRWAVYYLPEPETPLHSLGGSWLDRGVNGRAAGHPELPSAITPARWREVTESARRYGFHATLKPPFRLAAAYTPDDLVQSLSALAARQKALQCSPLTLSQLGSFLALVLSEPCPSLEELAADCVRDLDCFREPLSDEELALRTNDSLNDRELMHLKRWGYPYVLDTWKFHMTLTCSLPEEPRRMFYQHLREYCAPAYESPLSVASICQLEEPGPGLPFRLVRRFPLSA